MEIKENFQIHELNDAGKNQTQIAIQLGTSRGQVSYLLRRETVSSKSKKRTSSSPKAGDVN
ncbi:unnamed protein product [Blumeria hordei]|uniref:Uncharacterized protein n=1 Tax=Blumeria hordei TaxID=2867405 RepID=A0A383UJD7_BLUHO|nr:unnamed protein product [Blumeria hordei]